LVSLLSTGSAGILEVQSSKFSTTVIVMNFGVPPEKIQSGDEDRKHNVVGCEVFLQMTLEVFYEVITE
jgi:hypothetical protein